MGLEKQVLFSLNCSLGSDDELSDDSGSTSQESMAIIFCHHRQVIQNCYIIVYKNSSRNSSPSYSSSSSKNNRRRSRSTSRTKPLRNRSRSRSRSKSEKTRKRSRSREELGCFCQKQIDPICLFTVHFQKIDKKIRHTGCIITWIQKVT